MPLENNETYPNCTFIIRTVELGGLTKEQLKQKLEQYSIFLNEYGERLLSDQKFTVSETKYHIQIVELSVSSLGFSKGATTDEIYKKASELGLELCPLELGPFLRLTYLEQPEGNSGAKMQHQAPKGAITIATEILHEDDDFPKGFYLRRIDGNLWLRGYIADDLHRWNSDDQFVFRLAKTF